MKTKTPLLPQPSKSKNNEPKISSNRTNNVNSFINPKTTGLMNETYPEIVQNKMINVEDLMVVEDDGQNILKPFSSMMVASKDRDEFVPAVSQPSKSFKPNTVKKSDLNKITNKINESKSVDAQSDKIIDENFKNNVSLSPIQPQIQNANFKDLIENVEIESDKNIKKSNDTNNITPVINKNSTIKPIEESYKTNITNNIELPPGESNSKNIRDVEVTSNSLSLNPDNISLPGNNAENREKSFAFSFDANEKNKVNQNYSPAIIQSSNNSAVVSTPEDSIKTKEFISSNKQSNNTLADIETKSVKFQNPISNPVTIENNPVGLETIESKPDTTKNTNQTSNPVAIQNNPAGFDGIESKPDNTKIASETSNPVAIQNNPAEFANIETNPTVNLTKLSNNKESKNNIKINSNNLSEFELKNNPQKISSSIVSTNKVSENPEFSNFKLQNNNYEFGSNDSSEFNINKNLETQPSLNSVNTNQNSKIETKPIFSPSELVSTTNMSMVNTEQNYSDLTNKLNTNIDKLANPYLFGQDSTSNIQNTSKNIYSATSNMIKRDAMETVSMQNTTQIPSNSMGSIAPMGGNMSPPPSITRNSPRTRHITIEEAMLAAATLPLWRQKFNG